MVKMANTDTNNAVGEGMYDMKGIDPHYVPKGYDDKNELSMDNPATMMHSRREILVKVDLQRLSPIHSANYI